MDPPRWIGLQKGCGSRPGAARSSWSDCVPPARIPWEETAYFLDLTVSNDKPIVLIGAQRNASEKDFDGPRNLLNAARICVSPDAKGKGSMIALNNQINAAREVTKTHTSDVETFKSGDFGFLGTADNDRVIFYRSPLRRQHIPLTREALPYVEIVSMYGGADGKLVKAALDAGAKGIVIQGPGLGKMSISPCSKPSRRPSPRGRSWSSPPVFPTEGCCPSMGFKAEAGLSRKPGRFLRTICLLKRQESC